MKGEWIKHLNYGDLNRFAYLIEHNFYYMGLGEFFSSHWTGSYFNLTLSNAVLELTDFNLFGHTFDELGSLRPIYNIEELKQLWIKFVKNNQQSEEKKQEYTQAYQDSKKPVIVILHTDS